VDDVQLRKYMIVAITGNYDYTFDIKENDGDSYDCSDFSDETYECFRVYYDEINVSLYKKGGVCDSEADTDDE
jgi:hypothetical protein